MAKFFSDQKIFSLIESSRSINKAIDTSNLSTVLNSTNSTFEPVFIYDSKKNFKGLVSIFDTVFKFHPPPTSKASHSLISPPHLTKNSKLGEVINDMLSLKLHTLPVFDSSTLNGNKKNIVGILRAKKMLKHLIKKQTTLKEIAKKLEYHRPETIDIGSKISIAYKKLRPNGNFQLMVTDIDGKLKGIITRDKLKAAFNAPYKRQRFSKPYGDSGQAMFDEEEIKRSDLSIRKFVNTDVEKVDFKKDKTSIIRKVLSSPKNSVVIVDADSHPLGYVSVRDILLAAWRASIEEEIPIIMEKPNFVSPLVVEDIYMQIMHMSEKLNKISPIHRVEIRFKEGKVGIGRPTLIEVSLSVKFYSGEDFIATTKDWNILKATHEALNRIFKKVRRTTGRRKDHKTKSLDQASIEYSNL